MILNIIALTPLLERFEAEHGTLVTAAFFAGRVSKTSYSRQDGIADLLQRYLRYLVDYIYSLKGLYSDEILQYRAQGDL